MQCMSSSMYSIVTALVVVEEDVVVVVEARREEAGDLVGVVYVVPVARVDVQALASSGLEDGETPVAHGVVVVMDLANGGGRLESRTTTHGHD